MSEPSNLISNLNEIMEEYVENEEEGIQEVQSRVVHEEEQGETRTETEQLTEETRKRKRGAEEDEIEQGQEEVVSEFVSDSAFVLWEKSLNEKDFIVKRGFNKLISPFIKVIEKRG